MSFVRWSHAWKAEDVLYVRADKTPLVTIGACSYASSVNIYDYSDSAPYGTAPGEIKIGRFCSIGTNVDIMLDGSHDYRNVSTSPMMPLVDDYRVAPVRQREITTIGNDVWIGNNASLLSGVDIGHGAVIGANAVVAKDVPPFAIVAGNPGRIVKFRFSEDEIQSLLKIEWWNWSAERIKEHIDDIRSHDVEGFIKLALRLYS